MSLELVRGDGWLTRASGSLRNEGIYGAMGGSLELVDRSEMRAYGPHMAVRGVVFYLLPTYSPPTLTSAQQSTAPKYPGVEVILRGTHRRSP